MLDLSESELKSTPRSLTYLHRTTNQKSIRSFLRFIKNFQKLNRFAKLNKSAINKLKQGGLNKKGYRKISSSNFLFFPLTLCIKSLKIQLKYHLKNVWTWNWSLYMQLRKSEERIIELSLQTSLRSEKGSKGIQIKLSHLSV